MWTVLRKAGIALGTLVLVTAFTFAANTLKSPEQIARSTIGRHAAPDQIEAFVEKHGLDAPLPVRYLDWLTGFVQGDWGTSYVNDRPVREDLLPRMQRSAILAGSAIFVSIPLCLIFGVFLARRAGSRFDLMAVNVAGVLRSLPEFVVAIGLILILGLWLGMLPVDSGTGLQFGSTVEKAQAYVLPASTLVLSGVPYLLRISRAAVRESIVSPYTESASLRGLKERTITWDYAVRNAAAPIVGAAALTVVHITGVAVVVESVFSVPGMGAALVQAVGGGDTAVIQAIVAVVGAVIVLTFVLAEALTRALSPRLRV